ncbi:hypothetical protein WAZ07_00540 [Bacillus sp. FJAT-51639]|uniref:Uncharacterized protein n=1 Tax=Bacillus bruguierae TaxID=3127667 RepID=A0ABU8FAW8_9BACI
MNISPFNLANHSLAGGLSTMDPDFMQARGLLLLLPLLGFSLHY